MAKIHTKAKRALKIRSTTRKHRFWFTRVTAKVGPKSFKTKEAAEAWAKKQNLDTSKHYLHELKKKVQWRPIRD